MYYQLDIEGFLYSRPGQGYFVKRTGKEDHPEEKKIFRAVTDDYLKNATDLGFSLEYILNYLKTRQKKLK